MAMWLFSAAVYAALIALGVWGIQRMYGTPQEKFLPARLEFDGDGAYIDGDCEVIA